MQDTFSTLRNVGHEDKATLQLLIQLYHDETPKLIDDIFEQASLKLSLETKKAAHALKGTCLNMGLDDMASICKHIEVSALEKDFTSVEKLIEDLRQTHQNISETIDSLLE